MTEEEEKKNVSKSSWRRRVNEFKKGMGRRVGADEFDSKLILTGNLEQFQVKKKKEGCKRKRMRMRKQCNGF